MDDRAVSQPQLIPGTLDLMVLSMLDRAPCHAYELARRLSAVMGGHIAIEEGSLIPALKRLEKRGSITRQRGTGPSGKPVLVCSVTAAGRRELIAQTNLWLAARRAVDAVLALPTTTTSVE